MGFETVSVPSIVEELADVVPPEFIVNCDENTISIIPSEGIGAIVVKSTVTLPAVLVTRLAGWTLVEERVVVVGGIAYHFVQFDTVEFFA